MSWIGDEATRSTPTKRAQLERDNRVKGLETGWTVFSYLLAGMVSYGAIGWLIGEAVHVPVLFPLGMVIGMAISVGFVIYRFGRQASLDEQAPVAGPGPAARRTSVDGQGSVERNDR